MRTCPMCGGTFAEGARFCPLDGSVLASGAASDPLVGRLLDGRYRLEVRLGEGGMGTVYRATHALIDRPVAVKVMRADLSARPDLVLRFRREAMLTSRLDHENCVRVTDVSPEASAHAYLVMELLEGEDLQRVIRRGPLPVRRAVGVAASMAAALEHAHALGVVHRDLKPENVFLHRRRGQEVVKVVDFGIARGAYEQTITRAGELFGTPQYMSPEQAEDPSRVDLRTDLYSLGATLFAMLTGRAPIADGAAHRALALLLHGEIEGHPRKLAPALPEWLDALVARCLSREPALRHASAAELLAELRRGLSTLPADSDAPPEAPSLASDPRARTRFAGDAPPPPTPTGLAASPQATADPRAPTVVVEGDDPALATAATHLVDDAPRSASPPLSTSPSAASIAWAAPPPSSAPPLSSALPFASPVVTERRQLTVMVAALSDLAGLTERLDVDDLREVLHAFRAACEGVVAAAGGQVTRGADSGVLAFLGYPQAHEDDAARAAFAALGVVDAVAALRPVLPDGTRLELAASVGLHSGEVLVEDGGLPDAVVLVGMPPAVAARLSWAAEPNEVVVSAATHALVAEVFRCEGRREETIPGLSHPLGTHRVLAPKAFGTRFERKITGGLSPFVGRRREIDLLRDLWQGTQAGEGHVVLLSGDAGIGKSRVVDELTRSLGDAEHTRFRVQCWEHRQGSALQPVIQLLEQTLGLHGADTDEARHDKIDALLAESGMAVAATAPLLAGLLSIRSPGRHPPRELGLLRRKEETTGALVSLLLHLAEQKPIVLVAEDLHWADPSTLELLGIVVDQAPSARLLFVGTLRPEGDVPFAGRAHVIKLPLGRLSAAEVSTLLTSIAGRPLPPELVEHLLRSSDGNPLFVEESAKMVLESGVLAEGADGYTLSGRLPAALAPASLQGSLMARLDRLSTAKETAQRAAVVGREVGYPLLRALSPGDVGALDAELRRLVDAGLLLQKGMLPDATYVFKHALVQDTAYRSLSRRRRQQIHQDVARALEAHFPAVVETQPELVAHHFTEGGLAAPALPYWIRAGQRAFERWAHVEAGAHLRRAIAILAALPPTPERDQRERAVQVALGASLMATQGYAGPDVARAYQRARDLAGKGGDVRDQFPALRGTWLYYSARGDFDTATELVQPMRVLAEASGDRRLVQQALYPAGVTAFHRGDLSVAQRDLRHALSLYDKTEERLSQHFGLTHPGVGSRSYLGALLWLSGQADEGLVEAQAAVTLAQELRQPFSEASASFGVSWLHQLRGEVDAALTWADATLALAMKERFPFWTRMAAMSRAWARATSGVGSLDEVLAALAGYRATGAELLRTPQSAAAAELCAHAGRIEDGLALCSDALELVGRGERFFRAELLRVRGELLMARGNLDGAAAALAEARDEAQRRGAKAIEQRVATSAGALERRRAGAG